jgi:hypothetical protein
MAEADRVIDIECLNCDCKRQIELEPGNTSGIFKWPAPVCDCGHPFTDHASPQVAQTLRHGHTTE